MIPQRHSGALTMRTTIRKTIREQRRSLSSLQQQQSAKRLLRQCQQFLPLADAQHIAIYLSADGEIDTKPIIEWLWQQNKNVYLPVLHPFTAGHLLFLHYTPDTIMRDNKYGIAEPRLDVTTLIPISKLDLIATPLVAFDSTGQRLGMGGGYYDRTLSQWHSHQQGPRPFGLAHDCQQVESLPCESWDVPLPDILTPSKHWQW